jgi:hypothetical protein
MLGMVMRWSHAMLASVVALAIATPAHAIEPAAPAPAPASAGSPELRPAMGEPEGPPREPTWDDVLGDQAQPPAPPQPTVTQPPAPTPTAPKPLPPPTQQQVEDQRRLGNGLLIGAGVTGIVASLLNGLRVYIVTVPCQTDSQDGCSLGWFVTTPFVFGTNIAAAALAGAGGRERGTSDTWLARERARRRTPVLLSLGIPLMALGAATSISLRGLWLSDYSSPEGAEIFDFARPGHAFAYYGTQQLSASMFAAGIGMISYASAANRERARYNISSTPWIGNGVAGLQLRGRF